MIGLVRPETVYSNTDINYDLSLVLILLCTRTTYGLLLWRIP